ncbi:MULTISPECIES: HlyU family transcriptional regulator [unclassified Marinovum]
MSLLKRLFGGGDKGGSTPTGPEPVEHNGFLIYADPAKASGGYRIGARIEKDIDGTLKSHTMIRADVISSADEALDASINKAKQMINEQGDRIFG